MHLMKPDSTQYPTSYAISNYHDCSCSVGRHIVLSWQELYEQVGHQWTPQLGFAGLVSTITGVEIYSAHP